jgi:hypothetical protein
VWVPLHFGKKGRSLRVDAHFARKSSPQPKKRQSFGFIFLPPISNFKASAWIFLPASDATTFIAGSARLPRQGFPCGERKWSGLDRGETRRGRSPNSARVGPRLLQRLLGDLGAVFAAAPELINSRRPSHLNRARREAMRTSKISHVVTCHTEGEVGDMIVGGVGPPPGETLSGVVALRRQGRSLAQFRPQRAAWRRLPACQSACPG